MSEMETNAESPIVRPAIVHDPWPYLSRLFDRIRWDALDPFAPCGVSELVHAVPDPSEYLRTDLIDRGDSFEIRADVPGIPKEKIDVRVQGKVLRIRAENESTNGEENPRYVWRGRSYQKFQQEFELPAHVPAEQVEARVENGVLTVRVPKPKTEIESKVPVS